MKNIMAIKEEHNNGKRLSIGAVIFFFNAQTFFFLTYNPVLHSTVFLLTALLTHKCKPCSKLNKITMFDLVKTLYRFGTSINNQKNSCFFLKYF